MRKLFLMLVLFLSLALIPAALADTVSFDDFSAECTVSSDKYTVLTRRNLSAQTKWLTDHNTTADAVLADWKSRGVYMQAWNADGDVCIEISAVQDDFAASYYDVNEVTNDERKNYRVGHSSDASGYWRAQGYDYTSADWKNYAGIGRFLQLQYTRTENGETYRGYARKTIRNGYHIHIDYQVYGRGLKTSDKTALENVMKTWAFLEVWPRPATSVTNLIFTSTPPTETNTGKFTIAGTGSPGLHIIAVAMRLSASDAYRFEADVAKNGKFELDVKLPAEGFWLVTYTVENVDTVVEEGAFDGITYNDSLLPVTLNSALPATMVLTGNELVISGTTMKQTHVQCIVDGRNYTKSITTNNTGKFSFTIDTRDEGLYTITLVFEKKGYDARRFRCEASRTYTEEDRRQAIRDEAVKPAYKTLTGKISGYTGRYMVYTLNVQSVEEGPTGYITFAGMTKTKAGVYKEMVVIRSTEKPDFSAGSKVRMYLKCIGTYDVVTEDGEKTYPYFDLQWVE